jgi:hypothetical protein
MGFQDVNICRNNSNSRADKRQLKHQRLSTTSGTPEAMEILLGRYINNNRGVSNSRNPINSREHANS